MPTPHSDALVFFGATGDLAYKQIFAALRLHIDAPRWEGVPFYIRTGKRLPVTTTEVMVKLRRPPHSAFDGAWDVPLNYFRFRLSPDVLLSVGASVKKPGEAMIGEPVELIARRHTGDEMMPYERLLGDALLFTTDECVEAAWRVVDPVLGNVTPVSAYKPDSWGPPEAHRIMTGDDGWHNPVTEEATR